MYVAFRIKFSISTSTQMVDPRSRIDFSQVLKVVTTLPVVLSRDLINVSIIYSFQEEISSFEITNKLCPLFVGKKNGIKKYTTSPLWNILLIKSFFLGSIE